MNHQDLLIQVNAIENGMSEQLSIEELESRLEMTFVPVSHSYLCDGNKVNYGCSK